MPSTALEQYLLELINGARMDPLGDAARYIVSYAPLSSGQGNIQSALTQFGVSGGQLLAAFQGLAPVAPVAFNDVLAGGARTHDNGMIAAGAQSHQLPGEADFGTRLSAEGYSYRAAGENIYAYAYDMLFAQAGFMVDWGGSAATGGMQSPAGHRANEMNASYREVGVGVVTGSGPNGVGPEVVTEDFGTTGAAGAFILGVAYSDANHNSFYDVGEGVAGLTVSVGGASVTSAASGGYTLTSASTGLQTVQLGGGGLAGAVFVRTALSDGSGNGVDVKIDVVNGNTLNVSGSATVSGAVGTVRALGVQALAVSLGDGVGRTLLGNGGGDTLTGGGGNDVIVGGAGNDIVDGGAGANTLDGGAGDNTAVFDFAFGAATIGRSGAAWVIDGPGTHDVATNFQHYRFSDVSLNALSVTFTSPDPLFDVAYYLARNPDVAAAGVDPYQHYLAVGWKEGRAPDAWFDGRWYLQQNPDVAAAGADPLLHFEQFGWKEGRDPSLLFSDSKYLAANPDVGAAGIDPLAHYLSNGQHEGRMAFLSGGTAAADPLVSAAYYDAQLGATLIPGGAAGAQQAAWSYDVSGWQKGLNPDGWFNTGYYLSHNPDVAAAHVDPLLHYEAHGWKEGRDPSALFSTGKYLAAYSDVRAAGVDPLLHFVVNGLAEGRTAFGV